MIRWVGYSIALLCTQNVQALEPNLWSPHCRLVVERLGSEIVENDPTDIHQTIQPKAGIVDAVAVAVVRDGRYLLNLRRAKPLVGMLGYLGGKLSPGESIFQAAQRELTEEGKFLLKSAKIVGVSYAYLEETGLTYRIFVIEALEIEGEPVNAEPEKSDWLRWLLPDEIEFPLTSATWEDFVRRGLLPPDKSGPTSRIH